MTRPKSTPADALREVPPGEFVQARDALAAQLAKSGKTGEARRVARLRRPSPVVWALNRVSASRARDLHALIDATDRLRRAQLGRGDLRAATERYRAAFEPLVHHASEALRDAGSAVSAALDRRIRSTLLAAVTDRGLRADLEAARLTDEHADPGFAVLSRGPLPAEFLRDRPTSDASAPAGPAPAPSPRSVPTRPAPKAPDAERAPDAGRLARERARAARRAAREARAFEMKARRAERAAQAAARRVEAMRRALQALEQRSAALRARADEARTAHEESRRGAGNRS
jgi:hypothetical protein